MHEVLLRLPDVANATGADATDLQADVPQRYAHYAHLFQVGKTMNGFDPVSGNRAHLMQNSNAAIASMVADIDVAKNHIHLLFYIWLQDNNGCKVVEALKRAAYTRRHLPGHGGRAGLAHPMKWVTPNDLFLQESLEIRIRSPVIAFVVQVIPRNTETVFFLICL